jgi:nucleoid DNA-binding protein
MDKLGAHIIELLNETPRVYLPGLGTFKKERVPALFDEETDSFLAPSQKIILTNEKGSVDQLINLISQAGEISEEEAENQLKKVVGSILLELNEKGESKIEGFGKLAKDRETIAFVEDKQEEALPFYKNISEIKLIEPSIKEPLVLDENDKEEIIEPFIPIEEFEPQGKSINWLWPIAIIIVLVITGAFWFLNSKGIKKEEAAFSKPSKNDSTQAASSIIIDSDTTVINEQDTTLSSLIQESTEPIAETHVEPVTTFEIIIVSFGKFSEAEKYVENMNAKGYKIRILENKNPGNLYKISYGSFTDEVEAQQELNKVREDFSKEACIYKKKN